MFNDEAFNEICNVYQKGLDLETGRICQFVWIKTPDSIKDNRLLIVVHHLGIDGVSWRILLNDLQDCLSMASTGTAIQFGNKGSSYREWGQSLNELATTPKLEKQITYWQTIKQNYQPFTKLSNKKLAQRQKTKTYTVSLEASQTSDLLKKVHHVYRTEINDFLMAALTKTFGHWSGNSHITIALENHGREELDSDINLSQTVGWFTSLFPTAVAYDREMSPKELLISTKEYRNRIPDKGIGYGILKYLHPSEEIRETFAEDNWNMLFNYLGQLDLVGQDGKLISLAKESVGQEVSADFPLSCGLEITGSITNGTLTLDWNFSTSFYEEDTIKDLGIEFINNLKQLIQHCLTENKNHPTPADFNLSQVVSSKEFDQFLIDINQKVSAIYPLSSVQKGMLFHGLYDKKSDAYLEQITFDILAPDLDHELLKESWNHLLRNHSALRSSFFYEGLNMPLQTVAKEIGIPFTFQDLSSLPASEKRKVLDQWIAIDAKEKFDFSIVPLMRVGLLKLDATNYKMVWAYHHILLDGWSLPIIIEELFNVYDELKSGKEVTTKKEDIYQDYIELLQERDVREEEKFWKNYFDGFKSPSLLPYVTSTENRNKGEAVTAFEYLNFDKAYTREISKYVQANQITINTFVQGVWSILLSKLCGQKEVVFGVTVSGRTTEMSDIENRVGLFINTLPLRAKFDDQQKLTKWLTDLQSKHAATRNFQHSGVNDIKNWCSLPAELFDSILVFQNYPLRSVLSGQWSLSVEDITFKSKNNYLFSITAAGLDQRLDIEFEYKSALIDQQTAMMIKNNFKEVMDQLIFDGVEELESISLSSIEEQEALTNSETLISLFEKQVAKTPNQLAVTYQNKQLSFAELDEQANKLSDYLQFTYDLQADDLIGVMMDASEWAIIAILGILKTGAAYVPIDVEFPKERKSFIIEDTSLKLLIVDSKSLNINDQWKAPTFEIDTQLELVQFDDLKENPIIDPSSLAYVIYTSGSTGQPKGVMIEHRGIVNTIKASANAFEIGNDTHCLQFAALTFDASVSEIFCSLLFGGKLFIIDQQTKRTPDLLLNYLSENEIEVATLPPAYLRTLDVGKMTNLKVLITAGEAADQEKTNSFLKLGNYRNAYGPTEASICATVYPIEKGGRISQSNVPIGRAIENAQIFLLDENHNLVSEGTLGEICIGGPGVARGYLNRPTLTAEKFIVNPFDMTGSSKLYCTNDLGKWLPDGNLEFHGRKDNQVKIRGYRIELGEIEMVLNQHEAVETAVVLYIKDDKDPYLLAYFKGAKDLNKTKLRTYLSSKLPKYMIPALFLKVDAFPINNSGKIDRKTLLNQRNSQTNKPESVIQEVDRNPKEVHLNSTEGKLKNLEDKMVSIWQEVLKDRLRNYTDATKQKINHDDNFFEIGGDSILAVYLSSKIYKEFNLKVEVADIFEYPILSDLTAHLSKSTASKIKDIPLVKYHPYYDASSSQSRFYLLHQLSDDPTRYNLSGTLLIEGPLDLTVFKNSLFSLLEQYESLRTSFKEVDGVVKQFVYGVEQTAIPMDYFDMRDEEYSLIEATKFVHSKELPVFDLSKTPLFQMDFYQIGNTEYLLLINIHHIICDEWSLSVFMKKIKKYYEQIKGGNTKLPMPKLQYKDYVVWSKNKIQENGAKLKNYWQEQFKEGVPKLNLPLDYKRPAYRSSKGVRLNNYLAPAQLASIQNILEKEDVTHYMFFTALVSFFLHKITNQKSIVFGTPFSGRVHPDLEDQIGLFINTIVLKQDIEGEDTFRDCLQNAKQCILGAQEHQLLPFDQLVAEIDYEREVGRNPLFDVWLVYQNAEVMDKEFQELSQDIKMTVVEDGVILNRYDLKFAFIKTENKIEVNFEYSKDVFKDTTGQKLFDAFLQCLDYFTQHFDKKVKTSPLDFKQLKEKIIKTGPKKVARR